METEDSHNYVSLTKDFSLWILIDEVKTSIQDDNGAIVQSKVASEKFAWGVGRSRLNCRTNNFIATPTRVRRMLHSHAKSSAATLLLGHCQGHSVIRPAFLALSTSIFEAPSRAFQRFIVYFTENSRHPVYENRSAINNKFNLFNEAKHKIHVRSPTLRSKRTDLWDFLQTHLIKVISNGPLNPARIAFHQFSQASCYRYYVTSSPGTADTWLYSWKSPLRVISGFKDPDRSAYRKTVSRCHEEEML